MDKQVQETYASDDVRRIIGIKLNITYLALITGFIK